LKRGDVTIADCAVAATADPSSLDGLLAMKLAGGKSVGRDALEREVKKQRQAGQESVRAKKVVCPLTSGVTVQIAGGDLDLPGVVDVLSDLLSQAKKAVTDKNDVLAFMAVLRAKAKDKKAS